MVVGGGVAGLTCALALARNGHDTHLVEASDQLGGMARSVTINELTVDLGSHRLHPTTSPGVENLLRELLGADLQTRERKGRLRLADRWVSFPLQLTDLVTALPPRFAANTAVDTLRGPIRRRSPAATDSFAAVVEQGLGPTMLNSFYGPYALKLWGLPADQLAGDLARRRIAASSPSRMVAKVARSLRRTPQVFRYPRLGYGQVVDRLVELAIEAGVEITTGQRVDQLDLSGRLPQASIDGTRHEVDRVMWTAPLASLTRVTTGTTPPPAATFGHRAMVLAYLGYDTDQITPFDAHYLPGLDELATRISEPKNYRDGPDPAAQGDDVWSADDDTIADRLTDDLARLGITPRPPVITETRRLSHVYPTIRPADMGPLDNLHRWAAGLRRVAVFGRQGLVVADNLHHVMDMGLCAARSLRDDGTWDSAHWAIALKRFSHHVVVD